jgi:hypothetical protein
MRKEQLASIAMLAVAFAVAALILVFAAGQDALIVEDTLIESGESDPYSLFASLSKNSVFLVSPQMNEKTRAVDHAMFNGTAMFLQVIEGNGRKAVQVIRVYDESNGLSYCLTNFGDLNKSERLEADACLDYLSSKNGALVLIEFPDSELSRPGLEISEGRLVVKPSSSGDIGKTCFLALRIMFKNSEEIIESSNVILSGLTG